MAPGEADEVAVLLAARLAVLDGFALVISVLLSLASRFARFAEGAPGRSELCFLAAHVAEFASEWASDFGCECSAKFAAAACAASRSGKFAPG
jgi:hypothetical protein